VNGIHDLGGMHGFGPVVIDPDEPPSPASWVARLIALQEKMEGAGLFNLDAFRYGIERMEPALYLATPYFERWLETIAFNLVHHGWITEEELEARIAQLREHPGAPPPPVSPVKPPPAPIPPEPSQPRTPRFSVGDAVVARNVHPTGHTRLPRYVRGKRGVVNRVHAPELLPDVNAHRPGAPLEVVYNVRFDADQLWGDSAEPRQTVSIDLWESYLNPDDGQHPERSAP
jgi:nitrile hydratase